MKTPDVCIMVSKPHGTRYTGVWIPAFAGMTVMEPPDFKTRLP